MFVCSEEVEGDGKGKGKEREGMGREGKVKVKVKTPGLTQPTYIDLSTCNLLGIHGSNLDEMFFFLFDDSNHHNNNNAVVITIRMKMTVSDNFCHLCKC